MTNEEQYRRAITEEIGRDLSVMGEDYQKGHKSAMKHALDLFDVWYSVAQANQNKLKENGRV